MPQRRTLNGQAELMNWRLILDGEYSGAQNMARDEALLLCQDASTLPVLRFYDWNPACVSIGRLQKNFPPKSSSFIVQNSALPFVRRPTGGRAVLHQHEITYCAVLHETILPRESRSVVGVYNWLSAGFIEGLKTLGVAAKLGEARGASTHGASTHGASIRGEDGSAANCFQSAAQCDFLVDEKKLIGAAQCRKNGAILQHGALLLKVDEAAWRSAVGGQMSGATSLQTLGVLAPRAQIIEALVEGLARAWNISFAESGLSESERALASRLHTLKYSTPEWNERGQTAAFFCEIFQGFLRIFLMHPSALLPATRPL